jgi:hypothetical protein
MPKSSKAPKAPKGPKQHREQVVVYLHARDRALLEDLVAKTGLARTELLRRGLWHLAGETLGKAKPGSAFEYLIATATDIDLPPDLSERADYYLYGGGYEKWLSRRRKVSESGRAKRKRAGLR